jgi:GT2 family glycosyltransferase
MSVNVTANGPAEISVIVLAYGAEPYLGDCLDAVLASVDDRGRPLALELILVDNGAAAVAGIEPDARLTVVRPAENVGFAGGCNLAAARAAGRELVFVNSDAIVEPVAIWALSSVLSDSGTGIVSGSVRLADQPDLMNTAGNPVHYLGVVWAGSFGEPAQWHTHPVDIASASGAFFGVRRSTWIRLGGFDDRYFAYHEDTDLSLRAWQQGYRVRFEPTAIASHHYEFSRNPRKQYLLERNRWSTVLTGFPRPVLVGVIPAMLAFEIPLCLLALTQGWLPDKLKAYRWLIANRGYLKRRRSRIQGLNTMSAADFYALLAAEIEPAAIERPQGLRLLNRLLHLYWFAFGRLSQLR